MNSLRGWGVPFLRDTLGPWEPLLTGAACIGIGPHPLPGAGELGRGRPGQNVASLPRTILCLGRPVLYHPTYIFLQAKDACRGSPPSGRHSLKGLRGGELYPRRVSSGPHDAPRVNITAIFTDNTMWEGGEDGWFRVP